MQTYQDNPAQWDQLQTDSLTQIADDDFLALLQKQYPTSFLNGQQDFGPFYSPDTGLGYALGGGINPQTIAPPAEPLSLPSLSPPSDDSPSPPNMNDSSAMSTEDDDNGQLKRKASEEDFEEGPSSKSTKKSSSARRKVSGSTPGHTSTDDVRLAKRKEQNRAAQRAFRERKEKHVKDLEDKVAALEAKNTAATSENENLRDLLSRLQDENMALKRQSFTFSMPKDAGSTTSPTGSTLSPAYTNSPANMNPLDMSSVTFFDPNMLDLLDENNNPPQPTATSSGSSLATNFGFGDQNNGHFASNYTTIASNPMFLSLASIFDDPSPSPPAPTGTSVTSAPGSTPQSVSSTSPPAPSLMDFDMTNLTTWSTTEMNPPEPYDDIFGSSVFNGIRNSPSLIGVSGMSPFINLHQFSSPALGASGINLPPSLSSTSHVASTSTNSSSSSSSSSSNSSSAASPATQITDPGTPDTPREPGTGCPKTRAEHRERLMQEGSSMFAPPLPPDASSSSPSAPTCDDGSCNSFQNTMKTLMGQGTTAAGKENDLSLILGPMAGGKASNLLRMGVTPQEISCKSNSTSFPCTEKSDKNVPVMSAWKAITQDPGFKDADINLLCSEFSSKARCDGTKVVLEPQGVKNIIETLHQTTTRSSHPGTGGGVAAAALAMKGIFGSS